MTVKIKKYLRLFRMKFTQLLQVRNKCYYLRKRLLFSIQFICVPKSVIVITCQSRSIISENDPIDTHHRNDEPLNSTINRVTELSEESLHHPGSNTLPRMLSRDNDSQGLRSLLLVECKVRYSPSHH